MESIEKIKENFMCIMYLITPQQNRVWGNLFKTLIEILMKTVVLSKKVLKQLLFDLKLL